MSEQPKLVVQLLEGRSSSPIFNDSMVQNTVSQIPLKYGSYIVKRCQTLPSETLRTRYYKGLEMKLFQCGMLCPLSWHLLHVAP